MSFDHATILAQLEQIWDLINYNSYVQWLLNLLVGYLAWRIVKRLFTPTPVVTAEDD